MDVCGLSMRRVPDAARSVRPCASSGPPSEVVAIGPVIMIR